MIKTWPAKLPHVLQALAGDPFKLVDLDEELVHVFDPLVEADVLRAFWKEIRVNMENLLYGSRSKAICSSSSSYSFSFSSLDELVSSLPKIIFIIKRILILYLFIYTCIYNK